MRTFKNCKRFIHFTALAVSILSSQAVLATSYVTLNDGRLLVFPDSCVKSTSNNDGTMSFTALDGTVFSIPLKDISSIESQLTKELPAITAFEFDDKFNYQVYSDATGTIHDDEINVEVAGIGKWLTATFDLTDEAARATVDGIEQVSGRSRLHFDSSRIYTVGYPGDAILSSQPTGGYALVPYGRRYTVTVDFLTDHSTTVPRIDINTVGGVGITSKEVYVDAEIIINGNGVFPSMTDSVKIKGRGNNTWRGDPDSKKPYRLKFAQKVKPLGLKKGKNWVLLANRHKGSMLTNAVGMKAASLFGTAAANHIIPVDLYINGNYRGSYNFTEKIGFAGNSVDLDDESAAALLELDSYYDEAPGQRFRSTPYQLPVNVKEPDFSEGTTFITLTDIKNRFNAFVQAVLNDEDLTDEADMDYLARFFLFNYYICNYELYHPNSTFCYYENVSDSNSKVKFGPVWDFDWAFGYDGYYALSYFRDRIDEDYFAGTTAASLSNFTSDVGHHHQVPGVMYPIWRQFRGNGLDELCDFILEYYAYAKPSFDSNKEFWNDTFNYDAQVPKAVAWLRDRAKRVDEELRNRYELPGDVNDDREVSLGDISALIEILQGSAADAETQLRADVNKDNEISIADVNSLIDLIIGQQ